MDSERIDAKCGGGPGGCGTFGPADGDSMSRRSGETDARRSDWNGPIADLKEALAQVESACNAIITRTLQSHDNSVAIAELASQKVADIESAAGAALERSRLQQQIEIDELRAVVDRLTADLRTQQEQVQCGSADAREDNGLQGDAGSDAPERVAAYRAQLQALRADLEAARAESAALARRVDVEKAKYARLIAAIRAVQLTKASRPTIACMIGNAPPLAEHRDTLDVAREQAPAALDAETRGPVDPQGGDPPTLALLKKETSSQTDGRRTPLDFDAGDYAVRLLSEIESMYESDTLSHLAFEELVDRLISNLKYGASAFARRARASGQSSDVFDEQLTALLDLKGGTVFGRHLAVAAYEYRQPEVGDRVQVA